ncbi:hypothetical protein TcCL_Unassigned01011 [Trypanosoma cruzi]|nr:hypothetical protein TcCL_Unassigned01011 [Trypanosoma cruzi]
MVKPSAHEAAGWEPIRALPSTLNIPNTHLPACRHIHARNMSKKTKCRLFPPSRGPPQPQSCACVHSQRLKHGMCVCLCLCVWQRLYLQSSCAPQESLKKATAERGR